MPCIAFSRIARTKFLQIAHEPDDIEIVSRMLKSAHGHDIVPVHRALSLRDAVWWQHHNGLFALFTQTLTQRMRCLLATAGLIPIRPDNDALYGFGDIQALHQSLIEG